MVSMPTANEKPPEDVFYEPLMSGNTEVDTLLHLCINGSARLDRFNNIFIIFHFLH